MITDNSRIVSDNEELSEERDAVPVYDFIAKHGFDELLEATIALARVASEDEEHYCNWHRANYAFLTLELCQLLDRVEAFAAATMPDEETDETSENRSV
jgi:hypothetical protein